MPSAANRKDFQLRHRIFSVLVLVILAFLSLRLVQMQIIERSKYASEAEGNAIEQKIIRPARGYIYDRRGELLVDNETTLSVTVTPRYFDEAKLPVIAELAGVSLERLREKYEEIRARSRYQTAVLLSNVSFDAFARLQENQYRLQGIDFEEGQQRRYHGSSRLSHVLGYVREINADRLEEMASQGYRMGDLVGITGVEAEYESVLRGRLGRTYNLVNVHGMVVQPYEGGAQDVEPQSGMGLKLAIDNRVQALAESLFVGKRGGAVMMDVNTGGIISMVSAPDFDLAEWRGSLSQEFVDYVYRNPEHPLFNRATQASLPPGSAWKPFMALVGLQEGLIDENTTLYCGGGYRLGRLYRCHGGAHGNLTVRQAIQRSCNTFFFRVMNDVHDGKRMTLDMFSTWGHRFGFGTLAPLDLAEQEPGLIPDSSYFNRTYPNGWGPGYTINLGIGQGNMGVSPLQLARYAAAIANGGTLVTPHLVQAQIDPITGAEVVPSRPRAREIPVDPKYVEIVQEGMRLVVTAGTARRAAIPAVGEEFPEIAVAGKTGTSENPRGRDHSVFIAFAPYEDPEVAVGVIVENAGFGSTTAAPIASLMIEQYLRGEVTRPGVIQQVMLRRSGPVS